MYIRDRNSYEEYSRMHCRQNRASSFEFVCDLAVYVKNRIDLATEHWLHNTNIKGKFQSVQTL